MHTLIYQYNVQNTGILNSEVYSLWYQHEECVVHVANSISMMPVALALIDYRTCVYNCKFAACFHVPVSEYNRPVSLNLFYCCKFVELLVVCLHWILVCY